MSHGGLCESFSRVDAYKWSFSVTGNAQLHSLDKTSCSLGWLHHFPPSCTWNPPLLHIIRLLNFLPVQGVWNCILFNFGFLSWLMLYHYFMFIGHDVFFFQAFTLFSLYSFLLSCTFYWLDMIICFGYSFSASYMQCKYSFQDSLPSFLLPSPLLSLPSHSLSLTMSLICLWLVLNFNIVSLSFFALMVYSSYYEDLKIFSCL